MPTRRNQMTTSAAPDSFTQRRQNTQAHVTQVIAVIQGFTDKTNEERRQFGGFFEELLACDGCIDAPEALPTGGAIAGPPTLLHHSNYISR